MARVSSLSSSWADWELLPVSLGIRRFSVGIGSFVLLNSLRKVLSLDGLGSTLGTFAEIKLEGMEASAEILSETLAVSQR